MTPLIGILKIHWISRNIMPFSDSHILTPKTRIKPRSDISLICTIETTFKHKKSRSWCELMGIDLNFVPCFLLGGSNLFSNIKSKKQKEFSFFIHTLTF